MHEEQAYERYLQERNALEGARSKAADNYDKAVFASLAGALAISMTFIADIASSPDHKIFLIIAWVLFGMSLVSHLITYRICFHAYNAEIAEIDKEQKAIFDGKEYECKNNKLSLLAEVLNYINLFLFLIGLFV